MGKEIKKVIPNIVQIAGTRDCIHCLDDEGRVWLYVSHSYGWKQLPPLPEMSVQDE